MRRDSAEVSAAARSRLEQVGRELGRSVGRPLESGAYEAAEDLGVVVPLSSSGVVPVPGRHARHASRGEGPGTRLRGRWEAIGDRVAWTPAYLAVVALIVAGGLGVVAWSALRAAPEVLPPRESAAALTPAAAQATQSPLLAPAQQPGGPVASPGQVTEVVVDVAGKVRRPGVATLPAGSRVVDAIRRAGGARPGVDLSDVNLARVLLDGEQILVGRPSNGGGREGSALGSVSGSSTGSLVNLNTATLEDLDGLPGVGPVTATKILDWRTEHGAFTSVDELLDVDGIGTKTLAELAPHVTL